jgi:hypothetical protein
MFARSGKADRVSLFGTFLDGARKAVFRWNEIGRLSSQEIEGIARDLHVSTPELLSLAQTSPGSAALLDRRLAQSGLSKDVLAARRGEVLRDMERVCRLCIAKNRCAADLDGADHVEHQPEYCPNDLTLEALVSKAARLDRPVDLAAPTPANR